MIISTFSKISILFILALEYKRVKFHQVILQNYIQASHQCSWPNAVWIKQLHHRDRLGNLKKSWIRTLNFDFWGSNLASERRLRAEHGQIDKFEIETIEFSVGKLQSKDWSFAMLKYILNQHILDSKLEFIRTEIIYSLRLFPLIFANLKAEDVFPCPDV